ncbi:hypothetical protein [Pueribacillus sp. YX66]|uniref:hypothetical protein n=1 Tax=Pueribacillus sp. YX66 TaxID=3229242 RepID=UPI00358D2656
MSNSLEKVFNYIKESKRLPVLFVGSGVSKRYTTNDYTWKEFLVKCIEQYNKNPHNKYMWYKEKAQSETKKVINMDEINQIIGGYVERDFNLAYYNGEITGLNVNEGQSPVKVFISQLLSNYIIKEEKQSEIALLKKLKEKMLTVITTNYDNFLEKFVFTNYETIVGQQIFWGNDKGSLLKIHGSYSEVN